MQAPKEVSSVAHHPTAATSNEASMRSHRPQQSSDTSVPLLVGGLEAVAKRCERGASTLDAGRGGRGSA